MGTVTPQAILESARSFLGTPFRHQGRVKGVGVDCAGLVVQVAKETGYSDYDYSGYGRQPDGRTLVTVMDANLQSIAIADIRPGDVLVMRFDREPQHLGIVTDYGDHYGIAPGVLGLIHSYMDARKVVEHRLDDVWMRRVTHAYRF